MKKPIVIFLLLIIIFSSMTVQAEIKKTTSNNAVHYELDGITLQEKEFIRFDFICPYEQKDFKVKLKAQSQLIQGQYFICLVLYLQSPNYEMGSCYIELRKSTKGKYEEYTLFPAIANYNNMPPLYQWVCTDENWWGIKYPYTSQPACYEGKSDYEFYFPLTLTDFENLLAGEELELIIYLNHSTPKYQIKNLNELRKFNQQVTSVAKQPVPTNNAPAYSLKILNSYEQIKGLLGKNIYSPELAGLLEKLSSKDAIYLQNFRSYYYKEKGISITVGNTGEIVNIGLHKGFKGFDEIKPYQGELPGRITFQDNRRAAEAKLGPPASFQTEKPGRYYAFYQGFIINYYATKYVNKDKKWVDDLDYGIDSVILTLNTPAPSQMPAASVIDTQKYISLLGQSIKEPKTRSFLKGLGPEQVSSKGKYTYYFYPKHGAYLKVDTATSVIQTLWFRPNALGFQPYRGNFEGDIWLLDLRNSVEEKLGEPIDWGHNDEGGFWAKYRTGAKIHYQYLSATNMFNPVTTIEFSLGNEPPTQPGAYLLKLLGKKLNSPEVNTFSGSLYNYRVMEYPENPIFPDPVFYEIFYRQDGITLSFEDRKAPRISSINLNGDFTGSLPGGITFTDDRESIWRKLGKPVKTFEFKKGKPRDQFASGIEVTFHTPDNSPGKLVPETITLYQTQKK